MAGSFFMHPSIPPGEKRVFFSLIMYTFLFNEYTHYFIKQNNDSV